MVLGTVYRDRKQHIYIYFAMLSVSLQVVSYLREDELKFAKVRIVRCFQSKRTLV